MRGAGFIPLIITTLAAGGGAYLGISSQPAERVHVDWTAARTAFLKQGTVSLRVTDTVPQGSSSSDVTVDLATGDGDVGSGASAYRVRGGRIYHKVPLGWFSIPNRSTPLTQPFDQVFGTFAQTPELVTDQGTITVEGARCTLYRLVQPPASDGSTATYEICLTKGDTAQRVSFRRVLGAQSQGEVLDLVNAHATLKATPTKNVVIGETPSFQKALQKCQTAKTQAKAAACQEKAFKAALKKK